MLAGLLGYTAPMPTTLLLLVLSACTDPASGVDDTAAPSTSADPFAEVTVDAGGLTNVSADLQQVLENGALDGACDAWLADPDDRQRKLLCGKQMFFDEGMGTIGVPTALFDAMAEHFPNQSGEAFSQVGMIPDPRDPGRPIGVAPGAPIGDGSIETLAFTCASCHFGQLPDGRYAVGAPNHQWDYATHMLALFVVPSAAAPGFDEAQHDAAALERVAPWLDQLDGNIGLQITLGIDLLPLLSIQSDQPQITKQIEGEYASWPPGTQDFAIAPLPVEDTVHTVSKMSPLWGIPTQQEEQAAGMPHAMLAWTGSAVSLEQFLEGFVVIGDGGGEWTPERLSPLAEYIRTLAPPDPPLQDAAAVDAGRQVFQDAACLECHDGPRGSGTRIYDFDEIGTDSAMARWGDPEGDGTGCCGFDAAQLTGGIKSPRLVGLWGQRRFLHNGSLDSLEAVLCLDTTRPSGIAEPNSDAGHTFGCDLPEADRRDLVAYLNSH